LVAGHDADVLAVPSVVEHIDRIIEHRSSMVLLDDRLGPLTTAEDSLRVIWSEIGPLPTIVMSGDIDPGRRAELIRMGAIECFVKDKLDAAALDLAVAMACQRDQLLSRSPRT
jgi:DNA-binding NarL/FixJ family response regulator